MLRPNLRSLIRLAGIATVVALVVAIVGRGTDEQSVRVAAPGALPYPTSSIYQCPDLVSTGNGDGELASYRALPACPGTVQCNTVYRLSWLASTRQLALQKISPITGGNLSLTSIPGAYAALPSDFTTPAANRWDYRDLAVVSNQLWVVGYPFPDFPATSTVATQYLVRLDPASGQQLQTVAIPGSSGATIESLGGGANKLVFERNADYVTYDLETGVFTTKPRVAVWGWLNHAEDFAYLNSTWYEVADESQTGRNWLLSVDLSTGRQTVLNNIGNDAGPDYNAGIAPADTGATTSLWATRESGPATALTNSIVKLSLTPYANPGFTNLSTSPIGSPQRFVVGLGSESCR